MAVEGGSWISVKMAAISSCFPFHQEWKCTSIPFNLGYPVACFGREHTGEVPLCQVSPCTFRHLSASIFTLLGPWATLKRSSSTLLESETWPSSRYPSHSSYGTRHRTGPLGSPQLRTHTAEMSRSCWALLKFQNNRIMSNEKVLLWPTILGTVYYIEKGIRDTNTKDHLQSRLDYRGTLRSVHRSRIWVGPCREEQTFWENLPHLKPWNTCPILETEHNKWQDRERYVKEAQMTRAFGSEIKKHVSILRQSERDHQGVKTLFHMWIERNSCHTSLHSFSFILKPSSMLRPIPYFSSKIPPRPYEVTFFAAIKTC